MPNQEGTNCRPFVLLAIVIAAVMFVFPLFISFPLLDPDEGLHASIALEMVERGDWIIPRFLGEPFFDKPILYFWMQAGSLRLFGHCEAAVRLPGLICGLLGAVTTGLLARRMFGPMTGWIAGVFYATTILPTALAQAAAHDVAMVPCVNLALLLLWESNCRRRLLTPIEHEQLCNIGVGRRLLQFFQQTATARVIVCTLGAGLFLGLSILAKGLLGVALVGLVYGGYLLLTRQVRPAVLLQGAAVLLVAGLVAAPWYLAVEWREPGFLYYYFIERHLLGFATASQPHSGQSWWYYLPILLGGGLPWISYVLETRGQGTGSREQGTGNRGQGLESGRWAVAPTRTITTRIRRFFPLSASPVTFLWFWLIVWTLFLTAARSKLVTYLWPAFPPVAILAAVAWTRLIDGTLNAAVRRSFARTFVGSSVSGPIVLPAVMIALPWVCGFHFTWPVWLAIGLTAAVSPLPLIPWRAGRWRASLAAATLSVAVQFTVVMTLILPPLAEIYSARDLAEYFNRQGRAPTRLFVVEERIGSFVFYLDLSLRAGLKEHQVQYLAVDGPTQLQPGDVVAVPERRISQVQGCFNFLDDRYEPAGRYRLYHITAPRAAE